MRLVVGGVALDEGEDGKRHGDRQRSGERGDKDSLPPHSRMSAGGDVLALLVGRLFFVPSLLSQPRLGIAKIAATQDVASLTVVIPPLAGETGITSVFVSPLDVVFERIDKLLEIPASQRSLSRRSIHCVCATDSGSSDGCTNSWTTGMISF